jgi:hypothetical protein
LTDACHEKTLRQLAVQERADRFRIRRAVQFQFEFLVEHLLANRHARSERNPRLGVKSLAVADGETRARNGAAEGVHEFQVAEESGGACFVEGAAVNCVSV